MCIIHIDINEPIITFHAKMQTAILVVCFSVYFSGLIYADDDTDPEFPTVVNPDESPEQKSDSVGSALALMDPDSSEDAPDSVNSDGETVIRAKRYCGYGCCGGCMNCNCATMAPATATYGPCGCCGCGYG